MIESLFFTLFGALLSAFLIPSIECWKARSTRKLDGIWHSAIQAPYYQDEEWHKQKMVISHGLFDIIIKSEEKEGKLQWTSRSKLFQNSFISGSWTSKRPGSLSRGYISLEISSNGKFMWGHIYGDSQQNVKVLYGHFIMAKNERELEIAYEALKFGTPKLSEFKKEKDYA